MAALLLKGHVGESMGLLGSRGLPPSAGSLLRDHAAEVESEAWSV